MDDSENGRRTLRETLRDLRWRRVISECAPAAASLGIVVPVIGVGANLDAELGTELHALGERSDRTADNDIGLGQTAEVQTSVSTYAPWDT